ncbi:CAAX protease [Leptolyngbya sp. AN02str]|uniref:CAAX protease n=1 Tax=Leptolyngbya sp. AN02str TaxID=3423363 RepID=UPI003D32324B
MQPTALQQFGDLLGRAFALQPTAFQYVAIVQHGVWFALLVVLLAGLSLSIAQSIILFINHVKPIRFVFSLLINAVLFVAGFIFLVLSTWLIGLLPWSVGVRLPELLAVLGLSYAPLLFSFLGALPYLGVPILNVLSVWRLLAMVVGFGAIADVSGAFAVGYVAVGWVVLQLLENTVGQPIAQFGKWLADRVAGVSLVSSQSELEETIEAHLDHLSMAVSDSKDGVLAGVSGGKGADEQAIAKRRRNTAVAEQIFAPDPSIGVEAIAANAVDSSTLRISRKAGLNSPLLKLNQRAKGIPQPVKLVFTLLAMVGLFLMVALLLAPIRDGLFGWYVNLPGVFRFVFDCVWIGIVALVFAGILAPLETLGWWAGWFGEGVDTGLEPVSEDTVILESDETDAIARYVVYLDGIGQSGHEYTPDVEAFLDALSPALPDDMELIDGLMMYSVFNKPLDEDRPLALLWRLADRMRWANPKALLGLMLNLRNMLIVAVCADQRYGPVYTQGIAQTLYNGLIQRGYKPGSKVPISLIGYSGGAELSVAVAPYLRRAMGVSIEVISLGGVMSANKNFLKVEHLYHIVGDRDIVERFGPIFFPGRWRIFPLSYWNRAKRKGKISILSVGPVGHQVPGGYMDPDAKLKDGRTHLQKTIELVLKILRDEPIFEPRPITPKPSHYSRYQAAEFVHPEYYPLHQTVDFQLYQPINQWMGRLILPKQDERRQVRGVCFEVWHAPPEYGHLVGKVVTLRWLNDPRVKRRVAAVTKDVHFSADAEFSSQFGGLIHPERLNHWHRVGPLESLAGSRPTDDMMVQLLNEVQVSEFPSRVVLYIRDQPSQITGCYYAAVQFVEAIAHTHEFRIRHFNKATRQFDGPEERVLLPPVIADLNGCYPSTTRDLERVPLNETGWYIYGAKNRDGQFVVQSLAPRALLSLRPQEVIFGAKQGYDYVRNQAWSPENTRRGKWGSVLIHQQAAEVQQAIADWQEGDRALVIHTYGGIGGKRREPAASTPLFFGHFAYGYADVVHDPLTDELRFDIQYLQVYSHNTDGIIAGTLHWSCYMGDRQFGWMGVRPVCDLLIKLDSFTEPYEMDGSSISPLDTMMRQLQAMTARYRIGDGTGGTYVGPANNCAQDSNQALFASIQAVERYLANNPQALRTLLSESTEQAQRFRQLVELGRSLQRKLQPLGGPRSDWEDHEYNLGNTLEDSPVRSLLTGLASWRTMLPRLASDTIAHSFLKHGATVWVLRSNQLGGYDPNIEPIRPMTL